MTANIKVYGVNYDGLHRRIVAAKSQKEAAALMRATLYQLREFGCQTGNPEEIRIAMIRPGAVWQRAYSRDAEWLAVIDRK